MCDSCQAPFFHSHGRCRMLASHLVLALAFWFWVRSLRLRPAERRTSLLIFVGLPLFNSYEGFDNYPTLLGAALFLLVAACLMNRRVEQSAKWLVLGTLCAWAIMLMVLSLLQPIGCKFLESVTSPLADFLTYYAAILGVFSTADSRFF